MSASDVITEMLNLPRQAAISNKSCMPGDLPDTMTKPRLGYLSAAPRVSTDPKADLGGARAHILGLIAGFKSMGWEVQQFIVGDRTPHRWTRQQHIPPHQAKVLLTDLARILAGFLLPHIAHRALGNQLDWVYERYAVFQSLGWVFQRHGIRWIVEANALQYYEAHVERKSIVLASIAKYMESWAYRRCDVLVCVTATLKEMIVQDLKIDPDKIMVVPNAVDPQFYNPRHYEPKRLFFDFTIGFIGTLYPWQGIDLLLHAVSTLRKAGIAISTVIVGDGAMRRAWEQYALDLGISAYTRFLGQISQPDLPSYIAGFDIGYSGQTRMSRGIMYHSPLKIYEYMAMAIPVIASGFADAQAVVRENETGFLFREGDTASLLKAIEAALNKRAELPTMGQAARQQILEHHTWEKRINLLIEFVERRQAAHHA